MKSVIHAGISSSPQAHLPDIPPTIQIPSMGNLTPHAFVLHPYFLFLYISLKFCILSACDPQRRLPFQTLIATRLLILQRPVLFAARGNNEH